MVEEKVAAADVSLVFRVEELYVSNRKVTMSLLETLRQRNRVTRLCVRRHHEGVVSGCT